MSHHRPWSEFADWTAVSLPESLSVARRRWRNNSRYFVINYLMLVAALVSRSFLSHPLSLLTHLDLIAAWIILFFFRPSADDPLVILGGTFRLKIHHLMSLVLASSIPLSVLFTHFDFFALWLLFLFCFYRLRSSSNNIESIRRVALIFLSVCIILSLPSNVGRLVMLDTLVGVAIVCIHGAFREPDEYLYELGQIPTLLGIRFDNLAEEWHDDAALRERFDNPRRMADDWLDDAFRERFHHDPRVPVEWLFDRPLIQWIENPTRIPGLTILLLRPFLHDTINAVMEASFNMESYYIGFDEPT